MYAKFTVNQAFRACVYYMLRGVFTPCALSHLWQTNSISAYFCWFWITELVWKDMIQRCLLLQLEFWQRHSTGETPGSTKTLRWIDSSALRLVVNFEQQCAVECAYWGTHLLYIICFIYLSYPESSSVYRRFTPTPTYTPAQAHGKTMTCQKWYLYILPAISQIQEIIFRTLVHCALTSCLPPGGRHR